MYYAIKAGENKGVYISKKLYKEKLKQTPGVPARIFKKESQKKEALKWAGVRGLADERQEPVKETNKPKKEVGAAPQLFTVSRDELKMLVDAGIERGLKDKESNQEGCLARKLHPIETIIDDFKKKGVYCLDFEMTNGKTYTICIRKHYYKSYDTTYDYAWKGIEKHLSNKSADYQFYLDELTKKQAPFIVLEPNDYEIIDTFIRFKFSPDLKAEKKRRSEHYAFYFSEEQFVLNINNIVSIRPRNHYGLDDRWLDETIFEDVLSHYKL